MKYLFSLIFCVLASQEALSKKHGAVNQDGRIVGGSNATSADMYPYQAYLLLQKGSDYYQCGGSIISNRAIVTAAHCVKGIQRVFIRIASIYSDRGGLEYQSVDFRIHPFYNSRPNDYDIAIIRLLQPMTLDGQNAKAVALPKRNTAVPEGTVLTVTGWGTTTENGDTSNTLMTVDVPTITNERCSQKLSGITARMLCAGEEQGGKDSCQGDSGGPAVDKNSKMLLGVVSFGVGCARPGLPGVYARVAALRTWIQTNAGV